MNPKTKLRELLLKKRKSISQERRLEASRLILEKLKNRGPVLSFTPIGSEINVTPLNDQLKKEGKLYLMPYKVDAILDVPLKQIDCILVPGLGFDRERHRIGYGKGYYDRFLAQIGPIHTIGVGFKEQLWDELLPRDSWDIPVQELILV